VSSSPGREAQALRRLTRELRTEPTPELAWDRLEERLLARIREPSQLPSPQWTMSRFGVAYALAAVAAVAALVTGLAGTQPSIERPQAASIEHAQSVGPTGPLNGDALVAGTRIEADTEPRQIDHPGRASWTLAAHSSAVLVTGGELIGVRLESGTLFAHVVPASRPESFAVDVGQTRVLVHGTVFSVERRTEQAIVEVTEGTVSVRPQNGNSQGWMLHAPARGQFSLDGTHGTIERLGPVASGRRFPRPSAARGAGGSAQPNPSTQESAAPAAPGELPKSPSIGDVESGVSSVIDVVSGCFARHTPTQKDMQVIASTVLTLSVEPGGRISAHQFVPPLAPDVESCSGQELDRVRFAPSQEGIRLVRHLELSAR